MVTMALVALCGTGIAIVATVFILHRDAELRQAAKIDLDTEVQEKLKKAKALDSRLAETVLSGANLDGALGDFTKARAAVHALQTDAPWLWEVEDLLKWAKAE